MSRLSLPQIERSTSLKQLFFRCILISLCTCLSIIILFQSHQTVTVEQVHHQVTKKHSHKKHSIPKSTVTNHWKLKPILSANPTSETNVAKRTSSLQSTQQSREPSENTPTIVSPTTTTTSPNSNPNKIDTNISLWKHEIPIGDISETIFTECEDNKLGWNWALQSFFYKKILMCVPPSMIDNYDENNDSNNDIIIDNNQYIDYNIETSKWKQNGYSLMECWMGNENNNNNLKICQTHNLYSFVNIEKKRFEYRLNCIPNPIYWKNAKNMALNGNLPWKGQNGEYHPFMNDLQILKHFQTNIKIDNNNLNKNIYFDNKIWHIGRGNCETLNNHITDGYSSPNIWHCTADTIMRYISNGLLINYAILNNDNTNNITKNKNIKENENASKDDLHGFLGHGYFRNKILSNIRYISNLIMSDPGFENWNIKNNLHSFIDNLFINYELETPKLNITKFNKYTNENNMFIIEKVFYDISSWRSLSWTHNHLECQMPNQRSPIFFEYRKQFVQYCDSVPEIRNYDWLTELLDSEGYMYDGFGTQNKNEIKQLILQRKKQIILVESRWRYTGNNQYECNHRCIWNWDEWYNEIKDTLSDKYYIIGGNTGFFSFETQYHIMRNIKCLVTMHGGVQTWTLVMSPGTFMFEVSIPKWWTGLHWARMLDIGFDEYRCQHCCNGCKNDQVKQNIIDVKAAGLKLINLLTSKSNN